MIVEQHHSLELGEVLHEYLEPSEDFMYHADFYKNSVGKKVDKL